MYTYLDLILIVAEFVRQITNVSAPARQPHFPPNTTRRLGAGVRQLSLDDIGTVGHLTNEHQVTIHALGNHETKQ